jgi:methyl coenzyme M reductase gamma subunit
MIEIRRLEEERKSLKSEKERLGETFESKLRRAQTLYETELTAAKMLYSKELEALRDHEEALKEELMAR